MSVPSHHFPPNQVMELYQFRGLFPWAPCIANGDKWIPPERGSGWKRHFGALTPSRVEVSLLSLLVAQPAPKH